MSVWYCIPSARPAAAAQDCVDKWRAMGYSVALWRDIGSEHVDCDYLRYGEYQGYAKAANALILDVLAMDTACDWVVTGGDDTLPDQTKRADVIAHECGRHFGLKQNTTRPEPMISSVPGFEKTVAQNPWSTFGVMQPTGDRFADGSIDRIAGSPWIGREFALRVNGGVGPYWPEYTHMFVDEEIMQVALKLGVFWQRPDLTHFHWHFMRKNERIDSPAVQLPVPLHLLHANNQAHWNKYQMLFQQRKRDGFTGAMP